nr:RloB family protein [Hymenobacter terricola]
MIVCEDGKTEPYYFSRFEKEIPLETMFLRHVGTGLDPLGVVERACTERDQLAAEFKRTVDETWVVFDKDDADKEPGKTNRFHQALRLAADNEFRLAFSNEVFELWLLLHLTAIAPTTPIPRGDIYAQLEQELQKHTAFSTFNYVHGKKDVVDAVLLVGNEQAAMQRAEALATAHVGKTTLESNPSTQVHLLVKELRKWIAYFGYEK